MGPYLIGVPERKLGFSEAPLLARARKNHYRMKPFSLSEAISYSYVRDLRFVLLLTLLIGLSYWWFSVPEQLLVNPMALQSPDLELLVNSAKKIFLHHPSSMNDLPSTSREVALNQATKDLLSPQDSFDPLGIESREKRKKALAFFVTTILISLALSESVSLNGVNLSVFKE